MNYSLDLSIILGTLLGALIALIGFLSGFYLALRYGYAYTHESAVDPMPVASYATLDDEQTPTQPEFVPFEDNGDDLPISEQADPGNDDANWKSAYIPYDIPHRYPMSYLILYPM